MTRQQANRLDSSDFVYRFVNTALGWSVVLQVQWIFRTPPHRMALTEMATRLGASPLHRRLVPSSIPFARPQWVQSRENAAVVIDDTAVAADSMSRWFDEELYSVPLDSEQGRSWHLRGTHTDDGGFLLSLTALHLVTDGKAMMAAAYAAVTDSVIEPFGAPAGATNLLSDGLDAARQCAVATFGIGKAFATIMLPTGAGSRDTPAAPAKSPVHERAPLARCAWATVSVDRSDWNVAAKRHGGTANSLFIAVVSGALRESGYAPPGTPIKVGVPVSQRTEGDGRSNATAGVSVILVDEPVAGGDLGGIRSKCKQAFTGLSAGRRPAVIHLQPLMHLLPDSLIVKVVTAGSGIPDAVTSNLGSYPAELAMIGGEFASTVAFRGIAQNVDPAAPYRFGEGLQSWLVEVGDTVTFTVAAFDELHVASDDTLRRLLTRQLTGWDVPHRIT